MASPSNIFEFFAQYYPEFIYNPTLSFMHEFDRLCEVVDWDVNERKVARNELSKCLVLQFETTYGWDVKCLESWQMLCFVLGVDPIPHKLRHCRKRVCATHVNICDLIMAPWLGAPATFPSEVDLSAYTQSTGMYFPKSGVADGSLLQYLLRHIFRPSRDRKPRTSRRT